jgi:4-hydroxy-tetrahydrodipicolinate synthase
MATPVVPTLEGVIPPIIAPLRENGDVDVDGIRRLVAHLMGGGVSGVFALGTSGEGPWLTAMQTDQLVAATVRAIDRRVPVLVGVLEPGTARTLEAVRRAEANGADALVVTSPYYFEADSAAQRRHVEAVAAATQLPLILYNIPQTTHNPLVAATVRHLLAIETVIGIKESSGDWVGFEALLALRAERPGFRVLQGAEHLCARSILAGADGLVPGLGNLAPGLFVRLVSAARGDDRATALALQERVIALGQLHAHGFWLACLKYAASLLGFGSGKTCGDAPLSSEAKGAIRRLVEQEGFAAVGSEPVPTPASG